MEFENNTPWDSEELRKFIENYIPANFTTVTVNTLKACPRVPKDNQPFICASVSRNPHGRTHRLTLELMSPKRIADRTQALDRLAMAKTCGPTEVALPLEVLSQIEHVLDLQHVMDRIGALAPDWWSCRRGNCDCKKNTLAEVPTIRGDIKARARPPVDPNTTITKLTRRLNAAAKAASYYDQKSQEWRVRAEKLKTRIKKLKLKMAMGSR